ncbi:MAG TPA: hypothetical protein VJG32_14635 [Anaerolineae bacterium]|nr:hypothetical protein [Anaerolineae bacterium]
MDKPLVPLTKVLLLIWIVLTIPGGILFSFWDDFATTIVWPPPLAPIPVFNARLVGSIAFATGVAALMALRANRWSAARPIIGSYVAVSILAEYTTLREVIERGGVVTPQSWLYIVLGIFYLVSCFILWRQQEPAQESLAHQPAHMKS